MALGATLFRVALQIADMDRGVYGDYTLTVARHPSETDERMMVRVLAFALHASDRLGFTRGLCVDEEPDLWEKDDTGGIESWIEVGLPEGRRIRKACARAGRVIVYAYGGRAAELWWSRSRRELARLDGLEVRALPGAATRAIAALARQRSLQLQCTVQDGQVWLGDTRESVLIEPERWQGPAD